MVGQVVLEWAFSHRALVSYSATASGRTQVVTEDDILVDALRIEDVPVVRGDPRSADVLDDLASPVDLVLIGGGVADSNVEIADQARSRYPEATLIAFGGTDATPRHIRQLREVSDDVLEHGSILSAETIRRSTNPTAVRTHRVRTILESLEEDLVVFAHDNPDPDAIASAVAVARMAAEFGVDAHAYYYGEVTHQSNLAFLNLLELSIDRLDPDDPPPDGAIALVDHAIPGVNDSLPPDTPVTMIFDHHTPGGAVEGGYVDLRESIGATSSIVVEYLRQLEIEIDTPLASALLYGIQTDTRNFSRKVSTLDFESASYIWAQADQQMLARIARPGISPETLSTIAEAITQRVLRGSVATACVGEVNERDAIGQAADLLIQMEGIRVVLVYGFLDRIAYASARARGGPPLNLATVMRDAFDQIGTAGGHEEMAGAQIPLGLLAGSEMSASDDPTAEIRDVIDERFFEAIANNHSVAHLLLGDGA